MIDSTYVLGTQGTNLNEADEKYCYTTPMSRHAAEFVWTIDVGLTRGNDHEFQDGRTRTWRALTEEYGRRGDTKPQDFVKMMSLLTVSWVRQFSESIPSHFFVVGPSNTVDEIIEKRPELH